MASYKSFAFVALLILIQTCLGEKKSIIIQDDSSALQQLQARIQKAGGITQSALGDSNIWKYLLEALLIGEEVYTEMQLYHIQFSLSNQNGNYELFVTGSTTIWNQTNVDIMFVFYYSSGLELALSFGYNASVIPAQLWPTNSKAWFEGLTLVGENTVAVSTSTFTDNKGNSFTQGLTLTAHAQTNEKLPAQDQLYSLIHGPQTGTQDYLRRLRARVPITGTLVANFPLSTSEPLTHWTLTIDGTIYFASPNVQSNNVVMQFEISADNADVSLNCDLTITNLGGGGSQPVTFAINSQITTSSGFTFNGDLVGTWNQPFGIRWMSFNSLDINFVFNPMATPTVANLNFNGGMNLVFATLPKPITVNFAGDIGTNCQQIMIVAEVPVVDLEVLFGVTVGKQPPMAGQLTASGQVNFALSTYDGQYQKGFTINGNVDVQKTGPIANTIKAIQENNEEWTYAFQLYVPIFSQNPQDINFYLTETGPIKLSPTLTMMGYHIEFDMTPEDQVSLSSTVDWNNPREPMTFDVSIIITASQTTTTVAMSGDLQGTWYHPLGLKWLSLTDVSASLTLTNGVPQAFSFQGTANVSFGDVADASITIIIPGPTFSEFSFTIDLLIPNMEVFLDDVVGASRVPKVTSEIYLACQLSVSTFAHDNVVAGIMVSGQAIVSGGGEIARAIKSIDPNGQFTYDLSLSLPIFSSTPWDVSFSLAETGTFVLSKHITLNGFSINFVIGPSPQAGVSADAIVQLNRYPNPFHIIFNAELGGSALLSFTGIIQGAWQPFSMSWFTATSASATLVFGDFQVQSFGIAGKANITVLGNTDASFTLSTSEDFYDSYIEITALSIANLGDFIKAITGITPPPVIGDMITVTNTFEFILSTFSNGQINEGLTLSDKVKITGDLMNKMKVFNQNGVVANATYGMALTIPVFPGQALDFHVDLTAPVNIKVNKAMTITQLEIKVDTDPLEIGVGGTMYVTFAKNPQLEFIVFGDFGVDGTIAIDGAMVGTWQNMFGIKGLDISNVEVDVGFSPTMCVTGCISQLGLGYNITIGSRIIAFYGLSSIPEIWDIFLEGQLVGNNGLALSLRDVATEWNKMAGNALGVPIDVSKIPADWGFMDTYFYIAPEAGHFNNMYYNQGFIIDTGFNMFGMEVIINITVTSDDFAFDVYIDVGTFQKNLQGQLAMIAKEKGTEAPLVSVHNVTLTKLSTWNYGHGSDPKLWLDYTFFGNRNQASISVPVIGLYGSFHTFFENYLSKIFG